MQHNFVQKREGNDQRRHKYTYLNTGSLARLGCLMLNIRAQGPNTARSDSRITGLTERGANT